MLYDDDDDDDDKEVHHSIICTIYSILDRIDQHLKYPESVGS